MSLGQVSEFKKCPSELVLLITAKDTEFKTALSNPHCGGLGKGQMKKPIIKTMIMEYGAAMARSIAKP